MSAPPKPSVFGAKQPLPGGSALQRANLLDGTSSTSTMKGISTSGVDDLSSWMDSLNPRKPIPKLLPPRKLDTITQSTISHTLRSHKKHFKNTSDYFHAHPHVAGPQPPQLSTGGQPFRRSLKPPEPVKPSEVTEVAEDRGVQPRGSVAVIIDAADSGLSHRDSPAVSPPLTATPRSTSTAEANEPTPVAPSRKRQFSFVREMKQGETLNGKAHFMHLFQTTPKMMDFFRYLLSFGGPKPRFELAPEALHHDEHQCLGLLFAALDRNGDGRVDGSDIKNAASLFSLESQYGGERKAVADQNSYTLHPSQLVVGDYPGAYFRKMDRFCLGYVDFEQFLLAFFPQYTLQKLQSIRKSLEKPLTKLCTTKELLSKEDLHEIRRNYNYFVSLSGRNPEVEEGCSRESFLSVVKDADAAATAASEFQHYDVDGDGWLTFDEYLEMVKHMYPPFRKPFEHLGVLPQAEDGSPIMPHSSGEVHGEDGVPVSTSGNRVLSHEDEVEMNRLYDTVVRKDLLGVSAPIPEAVPHFLVEVSKKRRLLGDGAVLPRGGRAAELLQSIKEQKDAQQKAKMLLK